MTAQQTFRNTLVVLLTLASAYVLLMSVRILVVLLLAIIIASAARPAVVWLQKRRIAEGIGILLIYLAIGVLLFGLGALVLPSAFNQLAYYLENEDRLANRLISAQSWIELNVEQRFGGDVQLLDPEGIQTTVRDAVQQLRDSVPAVAGEFGGLLGDFVLVIVMGAYWITARDQAVEFLVQLFSIGRRGPIREMILEIESSLGAYVRGIVLVAMFVGLANFALLTLFGVPNAITLAFIIGVTIVLPIIGGYIGAAGATLLALLSGPLHAILAFISFVLVQQVENHYLTPRVMGRSVGLNPILIIVFIFIGFALGGVIGGLISVPIAGVIGILLRQLVIQPRVEEAAPKVVEGGILLPGTADSKEVKETKLILPETSE